MRVEKFQDHTSANYFSPHIFRQQSSWGLAWWMAPFVLLGPLRTCLFYLGHIFESSTAIDSLEIGVGLKIDSGRIALVDVFRPH